MSKIIDGSEILMEWRRNCWQSGGGIANKM